jgi:putative nucleotidyltransferase with HDIG domain
MITPTAARVTDLSSRRLGRLLILWSIALVFLGLAILVVALPLADANTTIDVQVGQSSDQDILAPRQLTYESTVLTNRARSDAAAAVSPVFDPPDARVGRQQVLLLRDILDYITAVRADTLATSEERRQDLLAIDDLDLSAENASQILSFDAGAWTLVQEEALVVLEQIMRGVVREDQLGDVRRAAPARISVSLSDAQAEAVTALVTRLIAPNSFYNETATEAARQAARDAVEPIQKQLVTGQAIVLRGQVVSAEDFEALEALGLLETEANWRGPASGAMITFVSFVLLALYIRRFSPGFGRTPRHVLLLGVLFLVFLIAARLMVPGRTVLPFLFPGAALAMLLTVLASPQLAVTAVIALAAIVGHLGGNSLELALYVAVGSIFAAAAVGRGERVNQIFWAGLASAIGNVGVLAAFSLQDTALDPLGLAQLFSAGLINGAVSASLTLAGFFLVGGLFDVTTSLQLIELTRPDHPLLRYILRNAPGTYQHSLQVSNLAEQAAERIGANALLTRVGGLYHDAGKALHPQFYVENQLDSTGNVHDLLEPAESARIIIGHVRDGMEMARRHRLPTAVRAFITEHHGTMRTMYQYGRAIAAAGGDASHVDMALFTYPGPRPQSKETALLMLADGCEAKSRADRPKVESDVDRLVKSVIEDRLANGQLDDTALTLQDLQLIRESFVTTLKGIFHPRLEYPDARADVPALPAAPPVPALPPAPSAPEVLPAPRPEQA